MKRTDSISNEKEEGGQRPLKGIALKEGLKKKEKK